MAPSLISSHPPEPSGTGGKGEEPFQAAPMSGWPMPVPYWATEAAAGPNDGLLCVSFTEALGGIVARAIGAIVTGASA